MLATMIAVAIILGAGVARSGTATVAVNTTHLIRGLARATRIGHGGGRIGSRVDPVNPARSPRRR